MRFVGFRPLKSNHVKCLIAVGWSAGGETQHCRSGSTQPTKTIKIRREKGHFRMENNELARSEFNWCDAWQYHQNRKVLGFEQILRHVYCCACKSPGSL